MSSIIAAPAVTTSLARSSFSASAPTGTRMVGGSAVFENEQYRITCSDDGAVTIVNRRNDEVYRVWGGQPSGGQPDHGLQFFGKTEIGLDDGTQVKIDTVPSRTDPTQALPSRVGITSGTYAVQIHGVDANTTGDLRIDELSVASPGADLLTNGGVLGEVVAEVLDSAASPVADALIDWLEQLTRAFNGLFYLHIFGMLHLNAALHPWADALRNNDSSSRQNDTDRAPRTKLRMLRQVVTPVAISGAAPGEWIAPGVRAPHEVELDIVMIRQMLPG